jgi:hypothetical protein
MPGGAGRRTLMGPGAASQRAVSHLDSDDRRQASPVCRHRPTAPQRLLARAPGAARLAVGAPLGAWQRHQPAPRAPACADTPWQQKIGRPRRQVLRHLGGTLGPCTGCDERERRLSSMKNTDDGRHFPAAASTKTGSRRYQAPTHPQTRVLCSTLRANLIDARAQAS